VVVKIHEDMCQNFVFVVVDPSVAYWRNVYSFYAFLQDPAFFLEFGVFDGVDVALFE
jgi:hypothetical protein